MIKYILPAGIFTSEIVCIPTSFEHPKFLNPRMGPKTKLILSNRSNKNINSIRKI